MTKVTFIWHDCFIVECDAANLIFDYWLDADGQNAEFPAFLDSLDPAKPLYVFVSHGHKDHFNPAIFGWATRFPAIRYVVSSDVFKRIRHIVSPDSVYSGPKVAAELLTALRRNESYADKLVNIRAFPSTDIGCAYMVELGAQRIFHAGDLNAWIWLDESTEQEVRKALGDYNACLRDIAAYLSSVEGSQAFDYCFFPVDSRIGREYWTGAKIFVEKFEVRHFFPMHFDLGDEAERRERLRDALNFNNYANLSRGEYIPLAIHATSFITET